MNIYKLWSAVGFLWHAPVRSAFFHHFSVYTFPSNPQKVMADYHNQSSPPLPPNRSPLKPENEWSYASHMPGIWSESTMFVIYNRLGGISSTLSSLSSCKEFQDKLFLLLFFSKVGWAFLGLLKHTLVIGPCTFFLGHFLPRAGAFPLGLFYIFSI